MSAAPSMLDLLEQQATLLCQPSTRDRDLAIIHITKQMVLLEKQRHQAVLFSFEAIEGMRRNIRKSKRERLF